MPKNCPCL
ncbi:UNVERIFIED_CONTAM: hypothetical protein GTU68_002714 [Idotea baltica]|nr:hypothetical protein [Idotea baltica]